MEKVKYPRTYHLFGVSETISTDDKTLRDFSSFENGDEIAVTEKMDGENTSIYREYTHARSLDSVDHPSRSWVKGLWGKIRWNIPVDWRICLENCYAHHSIFYENLETYAYVLNIWNEKNECLSLDDTLEWCELLDLKHVPIIYRGEWNYNKIKEIYNSLDKSEKEGIVIRKTKSFPYDEFENNYVKAVRKSHVQTDEHWMSKPVVSNKLK